MNIHRRFAAAALIAACVAASPSTAQDFPSRLVHLVVPQAAILVLVREHDLHDEAEG